MHSSHVAEVAFWIAWVVFRAWIAPPLFMERIFLGANHVQDICRCLLINKVASAHTGSCATWISCALPQRSLPEDHWVALSTRLIRFHLPSVFRS